MLLIVGVALIFGDGQKKEFSGFAALPIYYFIYAYFYIHAFPVKALKTIELGREAKLGKYAGGMALMLVWPLGIWFLQPRVNKIK